MNSWYIRWFFNKMPFLQVSDNLMYRKPDSFFFYFLFCIRLVLPIFCFLYLLLATFMMIFHFFYSSSTSHPIFPFTISLNSKKEFLSSTFFVPFYYQLSWFYSQYPVKRIYSIIFYSQYCHTHFLFFYSQYP